MRADPDLALPALRTILMLTATGTGTGPSRGVNVIGRVRLVLVAAITGLIFVAVANAGPTPVRPHLEASSPAANTVDLEWSGIDGPIAIVWQCSSFGCYDTLHPNTGELRVTAPAGIDAYQVCYPGPVQDICSNIAPVQVD